MKLFRGFLIVVLGIAALSLIACQSIPNTEQTECEPVKSPFPTPGGEADAFQFNPNIDIGRVCSFRGQVSMGEIYQHPITEELVFCLVPYTSWHENDGWEIVITDTLENPCSDSFVPLVTPPFHGMNAIDIAGWHFRNEGNTAKNDGSVNAPQKEREFNFVFNQEDYEAISNAYNSSCWPPSAECAPGDPDLSQIPRSRGVVTITNLTLGNLIPNEKAWIEAMEFEVKIYLPVE
ncbi:MAG: hypothetical protein HUU38_31345 [Anaerolineales bacterium]|nr:hypothetical protein [Anaerolineales bacterium]